MQFSAFYAADAGGNARRVFDNFQFAGNAIFKKELTSVEKHFAKKKGAARPEARAQAMTDFASDKTDPQGSYTGRPTEPDEKPVQDVDDL